MVISTAFFFGSMPKVQELLKSANEDRELGKNLNGDEAIAMGGAFEVSWDWLYQRCRTGAYLWKVSAGSNMDHFSSLLINQAAALSKAFRVKKFLNRDYNPYSIEVHYDRLGAEDDNESVDTAEGIKRVVREVFPVGNPIPKRKVGWFFFHRKVRVWIAFPVRVALDCEGLSNQSTVHATLFILQEVVFKRFTADFSFDVNYGVPSNVQPK